MEFVDSGSEASGRTVGVHADLPLAVVAREMLSENVSAVLVVDEVGAVGRITVRELARAVAVGADPARATAADFMGPVGWVDDPFWRPPDAI